MDLINGFQAGIATIGQSAKSGPGEREKENFNVPFPRDYSTAQNLVVFVAPLQNPQFPSPPPIPDCFAVTVTSVTPTGFTVNVFRVDSAYQWLQNLQLMWMAFYTTQS